MMTRPNTKPPRQTDIINIFPTIPSPMMNEKLLNDKQKITITSDGVNATLVLISKDSPNTTNYSCKFNYSHLVNYNNTTQNSDIEENKTSEGKRGTSSVTDYVKITSNLILNNTNNYDDDHINTSTENSCTKMKQLGTDDSETIHPKDEDIKKERKQPKEEKKSKQWMDLIEFQKYVQEKQKIKKTWK